MISLSMGVPSYIRQQKEQYWEPNPLCDGLVTWFLQIHWPWKLSHTTLVKTLHLSDLISSRSHRYSELCAMCSKSKLPSTQGPSPNALSSHSGHTHQLYFPFLAFMDSPIFPRTALPVFCVIPSRGNPLDLIPCLFGPAACLVLPLIQDWHSMAGLSNRWDPPTLFHAAGDLKWQ